MKIASIFLLLLLPLTSSAGSAQESHLPASGGKNAISDAVPLPAPRLEAVSFASLGNGHTRLVRLHLTDRVTTFSNPEETSNGTLEVTLYNVRPARDIQRDRPELPVTDYSLNSARGHLTVRFALDGQVLGDVFRDRESNDLLVTLSPTEPVAPDVPILAAPASPEAAPTPAAPNPETSDGVDEAAARWRLDRIVIDAGHGGKDTGALLRGVKEKDLVLPIALKLGGYLEDLLGVEVIYTRSDDRFIGLRERGRVANRNQGQLFISIHANAAANRSAHGTETFFLGMNKEASAKTVIERENSVIQLETDQAHYERFDQAALVRYQLAQSAFLQQSEELAGRIEHQFSSRVDRKSRGVKEGNLQVLWAAAMPAVLVEVGFLTNKQEARFLRSAQGVDYMASAIFRAVRDFKVAYEASLSLRASD